MSDSLPPLELFCFGPPEVVVHGRDASPATRWRKNIGLLIYLALAPRKTRARTKIRGMLWPSKPEQGARHSLNGAVSQLRTDLGDERLLSEGDILRLNDDALDVDVIRFEKEIQNDSFAASSIPRGEFCEGLIIDDAPEFDEWLERQRDRLHRAWAGTLLARAEGWLAENRFTEAYDDAATVLEILPYSDAAAQLQTRVAALQGNIADARKIFARFEAKLREIGDQPGADFRQWIDGLETVPNIRATASDVDREPPLVGRAQEHKAVFAASGHAMTSGPQVITIAGDPGMGKTRLANEAVTRFALTGGDVFWARPVESDRDTAWSTLRMLMRSGLADASGLTATDPDALSHLAALVPNLAKRFTPTAPTDRAQVGTALGHYLRAVAGERPTALVIDDAEYADEPTIEALRIALARLQPTPLLLIVTLSSAAADTPPELARLCADVRRTLEGVSVRLTALGRDEINVLVKSFATWCEDEGQQRRLTKRLATDVGGNPFFAVTFLRGLAESPTLKHDLATWPRPNETLEAALPMTLPSLLRVAVTARLSSLPRENVDVLRAASIGAATIDLPLTAHLTERTREQVLDILDQLDEHHLVSYREEHYLFRAPLIRDVVRDECITGGKRRRMRQQAITFLQDREDLESVVLRAELTMKIDPTATNAAHTIDLAEQCLGSHQLSLARRALVAAQAGNHDESIAARLAMMRGRFRKARPTPAPV